MTNTSHISEETMLHTGQATHAMIQFMKWLAQSNVNTIISGGCDSAKSELLGWYIGGLDKNTRIVLLEKTNELQSSERYPDKQITKLSDSHALKSAFYSDILIVDGLQTPLEIAYFIQLLPITMSGAATTHGVTAKQTLYHLQSKITQHYGDATETNGRFGKLISDAIDVIIVPKQLPDGSIVIAEITEVVNYKDGDYTINPIFQRNADTITTGKISNRLADKMKANIPVETASFY